MHRKSQRATIAALLLPILILITAPPSFGIWHTLLNEHFDNDQSVPVQRWPWNTPFQNPNIRWRYNPLNPYPRAEGCHRSDYSWGWQDYIYNNMVIERAEFPGALWCAFTNRTDTNNPRWPEDDDYMNDQTAWVWWGPIDLRGAVAGSASWWMNVDLEHFNYDSLSVVAFTPVDLATIPCGTAYTQPNFRVNQPFGVLRDEDGEYAGLTVFKTSTEGWVYRTLDFSDLSVLNADGEIVDSLSYLGRNNVYIGWVWHTNNSGTVGTGAFLDDVMVGMDDGLFDLSVDKMQFGYPIDEEMDWSASPPKYGDETRFRLEWLAAGIGETEAFNITCTLDDEIIFEESRQVMAGEGQIYVSESPDFWIANAGSHTIRWEIDTNNSVEESDEGNNSFETVFEVPWVPAPTITFIQPDSDQVVPSDEFFDIVVALADSNETDTSLACFIFWTKDTSGFAANPRIVYDWNYLNHRYDLPQGEWSIPWSFYELEQNGEVDVGDQIFIGGFVSDNVPDNASYAVASGRIEVGLGIITEPELPVTSLLIEAYPNPFNRDLRIDYSLPVSGLVNLSVIDLTGRIVDVVIDNGNKSEGNHSTIWSPSGIGGGVYLVRLETPQGIRMQKSVYIP